MTSVDSYTKSGGKSSSKVSLKKDVFGVSVDDHQLLSLVYRSYMDNGRKNLAKTKRRGEVSGGGKKPWRQKGTGRARFGSIRVPIWRGGGITFGPLGEENYNKSIPKNQKRLATRQALSLAAQDKKIIVIEDFRPKGGLVKYTKNIISKTGANGKVLIIVEKKDSEIDMAVRNLAKVTAMSVNYLNVYQILNADSLIITRKSIEVVNDWLGGNN